MDAGDRLIHGAVWHGELQRAADARGLVVVCIDAGPLARGERGAALLRVLGDYGLSTLAMAIHGDALGPAVPAHQAAWATSFDEALAWIAVHDGREHEAIGLIGEEDAASAALHAAAMHAARVSAVVTCNGQLAAADDVLTRVRAATLMVVSAQDAAALAAHREALLRLRGERRLEGIPGVSRRLDEPGAFETVAHLAASWLRDRLAAPKLH